MSGRFCIAARTEGNGIAELCTMLRAQCHDLTFMTVFAFHDESADRSSIAVPLHIGSALRETTQHFSSPARFNTENVAPFGAKNDAAHGSLYIDKAMTQLRG